MSGTKIAVTLDQDMIDRLDKFIPQQVFPNRSQAIRNALREKLERLEKSCLDQESKLLDPALEKALADEGMSSELAQWPDYEGETSTGRI